jgi:hypothetical protein
MPSRNSEVIMAYNWKEKFCDGCDYMVDGYCRRLPPTPEYKLVVTPGLPDGYPACAEFREGYASR